MAPPRETHGGIIMIRRISLATAVVVIAAISGVAATSASAYELSNEICNGKIINLCWNNAGTLQELIKTQPTTIALKTGSVVLIKTAIGGLTIEIECKVVSSSLTITQAEPLVKQGTIVGTLTLKECKIVGGVEIAKKCKIPAEKTTKELVGTLTTVKELLLKPVTGTTILEVPFENNGTEVCPATIKGTHSLMGEQVFEILNPEKPEITKSGKSVALSKLKLGEEKAELTGEIVISFPGLEDEVAIVTTA